MLIGTCIVDMRLIGVKTLKNKRSIIKKLISRTKKNFNVAIAEVGKQDIADRAEIGFCVVSTQRSHVDSQIDNIINDMEYHGEPGIEIIDYEKEIY
ncbi:MAG: DUF503 domain-containing protein [Clostridiales bacterium]|nr:MAG: DUF503 domain-containing protein [Clostridiales bacterium]